MRISETFPSHYLKASDLQGRTVRVVMDRVEIEKLGDDMKPILYFKGKDKGMVLNKTNANKIAEMFGDNTDEWEGGEIILYEAQVAFQNNTVPGLRVRLAPVKKSTGVAASTDEPRPTETATPKRTTAEIIDDEIPF